MIVEGARGPIEGVEFDGIEAARPTAEVLEAIARGRRDRDRPVEPGRLDRRRSWPCPGCATRCARASAPVVAVSPFVGGAGAQGPDAGLLRARRASSPPPPACRTPTASCWTAMVADEPVTGPVSSSSTRSWTTPRAAPRLRTALWSWPALSPAEHGARAPLGRLAPPDGPRMRTIAILPSRASAPRSSASASCSPAARARRWRRRCSPTCWHRCGMSRLDEVLVVTADPLAETAAAGAGARLLHRPRGGRPVRGGQHRHRARPRRRLRPRAAGARRRPAARPGRAGRPPRARRACRHPGRDRARPPRHRHQRPAAEPARRDRAQLRTRQPRAPRRPRARCRCEQCRGSRAAR